MTAGRGRADQRRARVHEVVHDPERQSAQAGLAERELEHRDRVLGRVDRDDDAVAHQPGVARAVHDHRARGVADDADADGPQQVAQRRTPPARAEDDAGAPPRHVQQERSRVGDLELLLHLDVRCHPVHELVRLGEQRLAVQRAGT